MSRQVALRLPEVTVEWLDQMVSDGAGSRAAVVTRALDREKRRLRAEEDAAILAAGGSYPDLEGLIGYQASVPIDLS